MALGTLLDVIVPVVNTSAGLLLAFLGFHVSAEPLRPDESRRKQRLHISFGVCAAVALATGAISTIRAIQNADAHSDAQVSIAQPELAPVFVPGQRLPINVHVYSQAGTAYRLKLVSEAIVVSDGNADPRDTLLWDQFWAAHRETLDTASAQTINPKVGYFETPRTQTLSLTEIGRIMNSTDHVYVLAAVVWHNSSGSLSYSNYCGRLLHASQSIVDPNAALWQTCPTKPIEFD